VGSESLNSIRLPVFSLPEPCAKQSYPDDYYMQSNWAQAGIHDPSNVQRSIAIAGGPVNANTECHKSKFLIGRTFNDLECGWIQQIVGWH
jgi:hypothetical protein